MQKYDHVRFKSYLILGTIVAGLLIGFKYYTKNYSAPQPLQTPIASEVAKDPTVTKTQNYSADGTKNLVMELNSQADGFKTYTFSVTDKAGENEKVIFSKTVENNDNLIVPPNAWSPDNKLLFLEEIVAGEKHFLVLKASGDNFANSEKLLEIAAQFKKKVPALLLDSVTGWASETLIVLTTKKEDGSKGPLYWFVVPSGNFLQLSS